MTTRTPTPHARALWQEVVDARRAEYARRAGDSREQRRADERDAWLDDLEELLDETRRAVEGAPSGRSLSPDPLDPRTALVELLAAASAWVAAMDGQGAVE